MSLDAGRHMPQDDREWFRWCSEQNIARRIVKRSSEARQSDTTLTPDTDLQIFVPAERTLIARCGVWFTTVAAADFKFAFGSTGSTVTYFEATGYYAAPSGTGTTGFNHDTIDTSESILSGSGTEGSFFADFRYNGTDDAFVSVDWAQVTSQASDTAVTFGSFLEYIIL